MKSLITSLYLLLVCATPSFAAGSVKVYNSGLLVLAFLGFCALVVVIQLIPAIMTVTGMLKGMLGRSAAEAEAKSR